MMAATLQPSMAGIHPRTLRALGISVLVHAALLLGLSLQQHLAPGAPMLTEVTWFEPVAPRVAPPPPPPMPTPRTDTAIQPTPAEEPVAVANEVPKGDGLPRRLGVPSGTLEGKLTALRQAGGGRGITLAGAPEPGGIRTGLATADVGPFTGASTGPAEMNRLGDPGGAPIALTRAGTGGSPHGTILAAASVPGGTPIPPAAPEEAEGTTVRNLAGATLIGPVADRRLLSFAAPSYPDWAKREGVEGSVSIRFFVVPDGRVKPGVLVEKTSGYADFDQNAEAALLGWRFEPLTKGAHGEQWGVITFHYRLNDTRR